MHILDLAVFFVYMIVMLGVGFFFLKRNKDSDDYYVGGRSMGSLHVGLSVVATDVGGGFSIGLGGLGFMIGIAGSWMLFTGLIGAWLSAVILIPRVKDNEAFAHFQTFPQVFRWMYSPLIGLLAGIISALGYIGFTSSQILAGAKLASSTFENLDLSTALWGMGVLAVVYTVMGGLKAVIYTDTIQWIILMSGLIFIGIPVAYVSVGGWDALVTSLPPEFFDFGNISWQDLANWGITIIPIWFVGMTLYQRIYATRDVRTAKRAWYIAGILEWPIMAMMGVLLGLMARAATDQGMFDYLGAETVQSLDPEKGMPMLLRTVLPVGLMGLMMSAYFSAILSTADSCLMASSGNVVSDIIGHFRKQDPQGMSFLRFSQITTLGLGAFALFLATTMTNVLDMMLYSYAFMVSGLFVPLIAGLVFHKRNPLAAGLSMLAGGSTTLFFQLHKVHLSASLGREQTMARVHELVDRFPSLAEVDFASMSQIEISQLIKKSQLMHSEALGYDFQLPFALDPNIFGITMSLLVFMLVSALAKAR